MNGDLIHRLSIELQEVCTTRNSISPKLGMHVQLSKRKAELEREIYQLEQNRASIMPLEADAKPKSKRSASKKLYETNRA